MAGERSSIAARRPFKDFSNERRTHAHNLAPEEEEEEGEGEGEGEGGGGGEEEEEEEE